MSFNEISCVGDMGRIHNILHGIEVEIWPSRISCLNLWHHLSFVALTPWALRQRPDEEPKVTVENNYSSIKILKPTLVGFSCPFLFSLSFFSDFALAIAASRCF